MITAPAPIIAPARPTCASLSIVSAFASSISLPSSLASWAKASLTRSGMERLLAEFIAISLVVALRPIGAVAAALPVGAAAAAALPIGAAAAAAVGIAGEIRGAAICRALGRALQEAHHRKTREYRHPEECGRLTTGKGLDLLHQVFEVAVPDGVGDVLDLRGGLPHIAARDRKVVVELPRRAAQRVGKVADIFGADVLLPLHGLLQPVGGL